MFGRGRCGARALNKAAQLVVFTFDVNHKSTHHDLVIQSFRCKDTEALFRGGRCHPRFRQIRNVAERKLVQVDEARALVDSRIPPQNRLKALSKDRLGQHAIRVNDQYRICFVWTEQGPSNVEIVDYHG